ncbi:MAG: hypothetical protein GX804_06525, partial [Lentisphaerae bacterium]|nr:hypothetical protein [Lentisphaerota bacterium]
MSDKDNNTDFLDDLTFAPDWAKKSASEQTAKFFNAAGVDFENTSRGRRRGKSRFSQEGFSRRRDE